MLSGGAVTSLFSGAQINDLDFYMLPDANIEQVKTFFQRYLPTIKFETATAITFQRKDAYQTKSFTIQLIKRFIGTPEQIHNYFDFTITQGSYNFQNGKFHYEQSFIDDIKNRRLVYSGNSLYPICAMYRTLKYTKRGYRLSGTTIINIALSIVKLRIRTYKDLKEQLQGVDTMALQGFFKGADMESEVDISYFLTILMDSNSSISKEIREMEEG
jgi:hypothetical protein